MPEVVKNSSRSLFQ